MSHPGWTHVHWPPMASPLLRTQLDYLCDVNLAPAFLLTITAALPWLAISSLHLVSLQLPLSFWWADLRAEVWWQRSRVRTCVRLTALMFFIKRQQLIWTRLVGTAIWCPLSACCGNSPYVGTATLLTILIWASTRRASLIPLRKFHVSSMGGQGPVSMSF